MGEYAKAAEELLNEFEQRDKLASLSYSMYFSVALHYLDYCVSYGHYDKFNNRLKDYTRLLELSDPNKWEKRYFAEHQITFEGIMLKYYDNMNQPGNFKKTLKNADSLIDEYREYLPPRRMLTMSISFAEMAFLNKMYDETLHWLNRIINYPAHPAKDDVLEAALILSIMTQYETGNIESMMYSISNARKHFRIRERLLETERTILSFFRKIASITEKSKLTEEFVILKNKIGKLKELESERTFFERLRMVIWINNKLEELNK
jgi:tetratricopeptide (TPR) repeat protein